MSLTKPPPKWRLAEKQVRPRPFLVGHSQGSSGGMEAQGGGCCLGPCGWPFCFGLGDSVNAWSLELWIPRVHAAPAVTWPERSQRGGVSGCHCSRDTSSRQPLPSPWPGCPESPGRTLLLGRRSCQMGAPSLKQALADSLEKGGRTDGRREGPCPVRGPGAPTRPGGTCGSRTG